MFVLSSQSNSALALKLEVLCSISKSPSKLLSKSWLGLTLVILTLSLFLYPLNTTYWHVSPQYLGHSQAHCTQRLTTSLQYFGHVGPGMATQPFGETSCWRVLYSLTSQTQHSWPHLNVLVGGLGYQQARCRQCSRSRGHAGGGWGGHVSETYCTVNQWKKTDKAEVWCGTEVAKECKRMGWEEAHELLTTKGV